MTSWPFSPQSSLPSRADPWLTTSSVLIRNSGITATITIGTAFGMNQILEYGADSATILNRDRIGNVMIRSIYILKMRGSRIANTIRILDISDDGMSVSTLSPYP